MMFEKIDNTKMLDALNDRVSSIAGCMLALIEEGYTPNKKKVTILNWSSILIDAYQNLDVLSEEQQTKIHNLFNKVMSL